eukprot:scaffold1184_cov132-Cylindrotheca_fusiformis.AAC.90
MSNSTSTVRMKSTTFLLVGALCTLIRGSASFNPTHQKPTNRFASGLHSLAPAVVGPRLSIDEKYPGAKRIYSDPDIFVIEGFLDPARCQDIIAKAEEKTLERSPVAYAGWTDDFRDLVELAAKGPVAWLALISAWLQVKDSADANQISLVVHALQNYSAILSIAVGAIAAFTYSRGEGLKSLRTSSSTTLDDMSQASSGAVEFVKKTAALFGAPSDRLRQEAALFEAPTVIRYEPDQVLAPHFDANRSADTEDANRGGQTLATLLVYLNDVEKGGLTRFGRLPALPGSEENGETKLTIRPKMGDALLFFPADATGQFDERTEHEGCPAVDEKWIARIWRHKGRVPPPFGLSESALNNI